MYTTLKQIRSGDLLKLSPTKSYPFVIHALVTYVTEEAIQIRYDVTETKYNDKLGMDYKSSCHYVSWIKLKFLYPVNTFSLYYFEINGRRQICLNLPQWYTLTYKVAEGKVFAE